MTTLTKAQAIHQLQVLSPARYIIIDELGIQVGDPITGHLAANSVVLELARQNLGVSYSIVPLQAQPARI